MPRIRIQRNLKTDFGSGFRQKYRIRLDTEPKPWPWQIFLTLFCFNLGTTPPIMVPLQHNTIFHTDKKGSLTPTPFTLRCRGHNGLVCNHPSTSGDQPSFLRITQAKIPPKKVTHTKIHTQRVPNPFLTSLHLNIFCILEYVLKVILAQFLK